MRRSIECFGFRSAWRCFWLISCAFVLCGVAKADTLVSTTNLSYAGHAAQSYTVPATTDYVILQVKGAGGGSGSAGNGASVTATYSVSPDDTFTVLVGSGGKGDAVTNAGGWPGGGAGGGSSGYTWNAGGGGGYSSVQGANFTVIGAGGGGRGAGTAWYYAGGNGGNPNGASGGGGGGGGGATALAGGAGSGGSNGTIGQGGDGASGGGGGGGGGAFGGGGGAATGIFASGGGGGSSLVTGPASNVVYGTGGAAGSGFGMNGTDGSVTIQAYTYGTNPYLSKQVFSGTSGNYTVPAGVTHVTIKAWGAGGAGSPNIGGTGGVGGAGAFVTGNFSVTANQTISVSTGSASGYDPTPGGPAAHVFLSSTAQIWAAGGGGGGRYSSSSSGNNGGAGGAPNGQSGGGSTGSGGGGASTSGSGSSITGVGGTGGTGDGMDQDTDDDGNPTGDPYYATPFVNGVAGGTGSISDGGRAGFTGNYGDQYFGGGGGGGIGGGGGGGSGVGKVGGGGGGSSAIFGAISGASMTAGSGTTAPATTDADYPAGAAIGGVFGYFSGQGAVVILAYPEPIISSSLTPTVQANALVSYWITAQNVPTSYSASGLPPGLTLNTSTGQITGTPTVAGTYTSTLGATNPNATTYATVVWSVDGTAPTVSTPVASPVNTTWFTLALSATDAAGIGGYEVRLNGASLGTTAGSTMTVGGLLPSTSYTVDVRAFDTVGNWSGWTTITVTTPADTQAPSAPGGLVTLNVTATSVTLGWTESSDDTGVTAYEVYCDGVSVGTTSTPAKVITGLSAGTSHLFKVRARDAAGNWSDFNSPPVPPVSPSTTWTDYAISTAAGGSPDTLLATTVLGYNGLSSQSYTVPAGANYVVIKAWGASGGGVRKGTATPALGGNAGFAAATYNVVPGDIFTAQVATGGHGLTYAASGSSPDAGDVAAGWPGGGGGNVDPWGDEGVGGGGASKIMTPYGIVWAAGGGGGALGGSVTSNGGYGGGGAGSGSAAGGGATISAGGSAGSGATAGISGSGGAGSGGGGGGAGYFGGGGGGSASGGGGGSSYVSGSAYNIIYQAGGSNVGGNLDVSYPGNGFGYGGFNGTFSGVANSARNGGNGAVVIYAYQWASGASATQTFYPTGGNQTLTLPLGTTAVTIKAWGGGAGGGSSTAGAGGESEVAAFAMSGGQSITINAGAGGAANAAGSSSVVTLPGGTVLTAKGGSSSDTSGVVAGTLSPSGTPVTTSASGQTAGASTNSNYPGNNTGFGGATNSPGLGGAVVVQITVAAPSFTSSLSQSYIQGQPVSYTLAASNGPVLAVTGLPDGLSFNSSTGAITGSVLVPGSYSTTITASNAGGTTTGTLAWTISADTTAPTTPTGGSASNITFNSFVWSWSATTDNAAVTAYEVERDNVIVGTTTGTNLTVTGLAPVTTYQMSVRARDAAGNWSGWSTPVAVTTVNPGSDTLISATTFGTVGGNQTYTVPPNTRYVVIKTWGGGGGGGLGSSTGGTGSFVKATYLATPGDTFTVTVGGGGGGNFPAGSGVTTQFFDSSDLSGSPSSTGTGNIGGSWDDGTSFGSIRWSGKVKPRYTETYTFTVATEGGAKLWVNNTLLINHWSAPTNTSATIALSEGQYYDIKLEYQRGSDDASVNLNWQSSSQSSETVPSQLLYTSTGVTWSTVGPVAGLPGGGRGSGGPETTSMFDSPSLGGGGGGGYSKVQTPYGSVWAGGGGGAGENSAGGPGSIGPGSGSGGSASGSTSGGGGGSVSAGGSGSGSGSSLQGGYASASNSGGGGGGYYGGGAGSTDTGGGAGSSNITGPAYNTYVTSGTNLTDADYPGTNVSVGGGLHSDGGKGSVVILAYSTPGNLNTVTLFMAGGSSQTYTVPANTATVVIKAWGAGGGGSNTAPGGAGGYVTATYNVTGGQTIAVTPGLHGKIPFEGRYGGAASTVAMPGGSTLFAAGGGTGGDVVNAYGGAGGGLTGQAGGGAGGAGGAGGVTSGTGSSMHGTGGAGGTGDAMTEEFDDDGNDLGPANEGHGSDGGTNSASDGGSYGYGGAHIGGYGGGGLGGGGGGGSGTAVGGGGGGGGSSGATGGTPPTSITTIAGSGQNVPATTDINYPGNNLAFGGAIGSDGGDGVVVITAIPQAPSITSSTSPSTVQYKPISYQIVASNSPSSYSASGLPTGLSLDPATGLITGTLTSTGTYSATISALNTTGSGSATVTWTVSADTSAPSTPTGLASGNATLNSFVLSWTASTDDAGVTAYEVSQDSTTIGSTADTRLTVAGLTTGVAYSMKVRARDAMGNWSAWSSALSVTLSSSGGGISFMNYATRTATTITLVWSPASADTVVAGYKVFRNGTLIATVTDTSYVDAGLSASTAYSYTVTAFDASGNLLPGSITVALSTSADFSADSDHDGISDAVETLLFGSGHTPSVTPDTSNTLQIKIQVPPK